MAAVMSRDGDPIESAIVGEADIGAFCVELLKDVVFSHDAGPRGDDLLEVHATF